MVSGVQLGGQTIRSWMHLPCVPVFAGVFNHARFPGVRYGPRMSTLLTVFFTYPSLPEPLVLYGLMHGV